MMLNWSLVFQVTVPVVCLILGAAIERIMERRPKLVAYYGHVAGHQLIGPEGPININTHTVVLRNTGRLAAKNVRISHTYLPPNFTIYPPRQFERLALPGGGEEITFATLAPGEQTTLSYLYFPPLTWNQISTHIVSDEGLARVVNAIPTVQYSKRVRILYGSFAAVGFVMVAYLVVEFARYVYLRWGLIGVWQ